MKQMLLFPDPRPLVERLGKEFFLRAPAHPGVYLMRDSADQVLYVGKAKNLRKRLACYRVANPDRIPRRHLRLLRLVQRIDFEACADEPGALAREAELLLSLRPRFNRAGTWPGPPRFLRWRIGTSGIELAVADSLEPDWNGFGPIGASAFVLVGALARLLRCALHQQGGVFEMPLGWLRARFPAGVFVSCAAEPDAARTTAPFLTQFFEGDPSRLLAWIKDQTADVTHPTARALLDADIETLTAFSERKTTSLDPGARVHPVEE